MKTYLLKEENFNVSNWAGGKTKEFDIFPKESSYIGRNFTWRLSSATCELDESSFTNLPDFNRVLMVLEGEVVLDYNGERTVKLNELEQDSFDGAWKTKSYGKITDFNLMVSKGNEGYLDVIELSSEAKEMESTHTSERGLKTHAIFVKDGYALIGVNGNNQMISKGQLFVVEAEEDENISYTLMGDGVVIRAQIFYDLKGMDERPDLIPREKGTFRDFKDSIFIANSQFRGAKYIVKKLNHTFYDEVLYNSIQKLERLFVTFFVFVIVAMIILLIAVNNDVPEGKSILFLLIWLALDCVIISPLIFFLVLPKPIYKHMKDYSELTPYEEKVLERRLMVNDRTERILRKYNNNEKSNIFGGKK